MCGIVGSCSLAPGAPVSENRLSAMLHAIRHRGPDEFGIYTYDDGRFQVGLGSARLTIIDLQSGQQPIGNEDGRFWIVFNGEIYNYIELRPALTAQGHQLQTDSDTEVILHLYEEHGPECLAQLNGQFAIAIWDEVKKELFLARDRVGIRPSTPSSAKPPGWAHSAKQTKWHSPASCPPNWYTTTLLPTAPGQRHCLVYPSSAFIGLCAVNREP